MRFVIISAALLASSAVLAQQPAPSAEAKDAMAKMAAADANKDGKWDKAEWAAGGRRPMGFGYADTDKDGFVTKEELKAAAEKRQAKAQ